MAKKQPPAYLSQPSGFDFAAGDRFIASLQQSTPPEPEKPSVARRIGDVGLSLGQGALGSFKSISDFLGADNPVSGGLDDASKFLGAQKSAQSQAVTQASMDRIKEAEASGSKLDEAQAYLGMLWDQPAEMIAQGVGSFATLGVGKLAQALKLAQAAKAAGVSKDVFLASGAAKQAVEEAAKFGFKTNIGLGAVQGVGAVKGSQFEQTYENARQQGMPEEEARALAAQAQEYGGAGTMQQVLGGVLGGVASATGPIERTLLGAGKKPVQSGVMSSVAKGFGKEFATEGGQGAQERFAGNDAAVDAGVLAPERRMQGVVGQGLMEGTIGGLLGGITGPLEGQAAALDPAVNPAKEAADAIRANEKVPESGALTKAVNAGVEAKALAVESGGLELAPLVDGAAPEAVTPNGLELVPRPGEQAPEPVDDPVRDQILALPDGARQDALRAYAVVNRTDVAKGVQQYNRKLLDRLLAENAPAPVLGERLTDTDMGSMLGGGGMAGRADPLAGALGMNNDAQAAAITNVANVAERRPPMPASDAARMLDEARNRGLDLAVAEHPAGGFVLAPPTWVTPDMAAQGEARLNETISRMQQADAAPVERAPRTRTDGVGLNLQTDPVQNYLDNLRTVNTPAARAYVRDFDAGRITPADVQQRMQAEQGLTPEQRIARAAAEAPAQADPVADRLARAAAQGMATPAPTDILNPAGEPFKTRMAADRAAKKTPGAVVPVEGGFVVRPQEPVNVQDVPQAPEVPQAAPDVSQPGQAPQAVGAQPTGPAAGVPAEGAGAVEAAGVDGDAGPTWPNMTPEQRRRSTLEREIATGMTNNGGVMAKLRPSAIEKRKQQLAELPPVDVAGVEGATPIVEVQDNYGRTHRVRQSDLYSNADRIPTVRQNGDVVAGEEIPRSIVKDAPTIPLAQQGAFDGGRRLEADAGNDTAAAGAVPAQGNPAAGEPAATGAGGEMLDAMDGRPGASAAPAGDVAGPAAPAVGAPLDALQNQAVAPTQQAQAATENVANDTPQPQSAPVGDEQRFAPESGTLGIPRAEMPQVPTQSHGGLVKHLNAQGIEHETTMVDAAELKPTQAEFSPSKVEKAKEATGDRAVIVSSDGHIIDGHHQALAAAEEGKPVKAIVLDAPVEQALEAVKNSPSAQPQVAADVPVAKPINRSDVDAARQQAATAIGARIDAMSAQEVQKIAARFLPTMGVRVPAGKARIKEAVTSAGPRMNWAAAAAEFGAELSQDAMSALQADVEGRVQEGAGPAMPSAVAEISPAPATHADPGQAPEVVTPAVVAQSVQKAARNEDTKPSEMRKWLVGKIDDAIAVAPEAAVDFLSFDVPGDGTFKVQNSQARLQEFRKKVMASPGFKDGGQKQNTNPPEQVDSARNGSGSTVEALRNFLADGDVQGAVEFAKLKGVEFTPVEPRASMTANGKFKRVPASVKSSVPSVAEGLTQVEAEQINQYLTAERPDAVQGVNPRVPPENRAAEAADGKLDDPAENIRRGNEAMDRVISGQQDEPNAMTRPDHGPVSFVWGKVGNPAKGFAGGNGIAKIIAKRTAEGSDGDAVARKMVEVIALGTASPVYGPKGGERFNVSYDGHTAVLSLHRFGNEETWLLTGWDDVESDGATAGNADGTYAPESSGMRSQEGADSGSVLPTTPEVKAGDVEPKIMQSRPNDWPYANYGWVMVGGGRNAPGAASEKGAKIELSKNPEWKERGAVILPFRWNDGGLRGLSPYAETTTRYAILVRQKESPRIEASSETSTPPAEQPDTPKLTPAEAKALMAWEDLGQNDGVKTHALTFYESQADKDAKRGRMIVAKVSKGDRSATAWMVDGEDKTFGALAQAKKLAEEVGMARAVADGFVEQGAEAPKSTAKPAATATAGAPIEDAGEKIGGARKAQEDGAKEREAAKSAKRRAERAKNSTETGLRVGIAPGSSDPVTVRDGTVYVGKYEAVNYDTGEPVTVPKGSTGEAVAQALKDAGALSRRQRFFGLGEMGDVVMFRVPVMGGLLERPVSHEAVERTVQSILKGIPNAPQVEVHRAPADAGLSIPGSMPKGGVLPDGRIVVFSDANTGTLDVMRTVFHELFHRGLKSYFTSNADYIKFMLDMATNYPVLREGAAQWKKSEDGQEKRAEFAKKGPVVGDRLANYEALAVEESFATLSETLRAGSPLQVRTWTRAIGNMMERIARLLGMEKLGDWIHGLNNSELDDFVNAMIARSGNAPVPGSSAIMNRYRTTAASIASSMGELTPDQEQAYKNVAGIKKIPTVRERMDSLKANLGLKLRQGLVDQFAAIKQLDQNAYVQARMSKGTDGTLEAMLMYGKPFMRDGAPDVDVKDGGFAKVLASLKGEQDRWMMWVAAQRAEKLKADGKENLMTDDDISALKTLNAGKMADGTDRAPIYDKALAELNEYNDAMLKLAMDSGLIDQAAYDLMAGQPYVPFYRLMEDGDMKGPKFSSGLTNQKAWQKLKGGTQQLNADLLQNMLLNWSHLLQASAKNRAAIATMDAAEKMAVAYKVDADTKGAVKVMREGAAEHWMVEDPYLLEAVSALHYVPSPLMKPLAKFKQLLTWGVTVNPTFKIRNLIRDSVSAIAQADLGYNPAGNVAKGWKLTAKDSQIYASMLASGGLIKFGTQENTDRLRAQVAKLGGVVLDKSGTDRFFGQIKDLYEVYNEFGDRAENVNRAALYDALIKKGKSHAEAAFMARDLMDFSMSGSAPVVRFLTQAVPFLNARLVGLDKLGRAAMEDPRRFATVTGAVALASLALLAAYSDDDDWKKREDWDRDAYWWFKVGDQAYRIPKPFEVGAIGTLAERTAELMMSEEMTGKRYLERVNHMLSSTFSFNPVPQAFKPLLDLYANKDSFTGRAIESQADQRLRPQDRYSERTPEVAKFLGGLGLPDPAQLVKGEYSALSPKQVEHLIRGYFSWVGTAAMTVSDFGLRPLASRGESPDMRLKDVFIAGNFVENLPTGSSRYVTQMYEQARQAEQAYASYQEAIKAGDTDKAQSIKESAGPLLRNRPAYTAATRQLAEINRMAKRIEADQAMAGAAKRARLTQLEQQRHVIAQRVSRLAAATP